MIVYLDTSTVLRVLFSEGKPISIWGEWEEAYSSELLGVEARRGIDRLRLRGAIDDEGVVATQEGLRDLEEAIGFIPLDRRVLERAGMPMATAVRTLDAIHISSALLLKEHLGKAIEFCTHDLRQATAARALGLRCRTA
jgi:predicted nucleic acid-binding protein